MRAWELKNEEKMKCICEEGKERLPVVQDISKLEAMAELFKGLADPTRLQIISLLLIEDLCMCEIVSALSAANSTISHHLKIMEKGGIIKGRREGKFTIYRLEKEKVALMIEFLSKEGASK